MAGFDAWSIIIISILPDTVGTNGIPNRSEAENQARSSFFASNDFFSFPPVTPIKFSPLLLLLFADGG